MTQEIEINGRIVLLDDDDAAAFASRKWSVEKHGDAWYVRATAPPRVYLHRILMAPPPGLKVDHINRNGLDNRRENLRLVDQAQNAWNARGRRGAFKGVHKHMGGFRAEIRFRGGKVYAGWAKTEEAAARLYDAKARELHGEHARLNFPAS